MLRPEIDTFILKTTPIGIEQVEKQFADGIDLNRVGHTRTHKYRKQREAEPALNIEASR